jgi:hypothetical protein
VLTMISVVLIIAVVGALLSLSMLSAGDAGQTPGPAQWSSAGDTEPPVADRPSGTNQQTSPAGGNVAEGSEAHHGVVPVRHGAD